METSWANYIGLIIKNIVPLSTAVESWVELANQKNGHDNVAVVLMSCTLTGQTVVVEENAPPPLTTQQDISQPTELTAASKALLYGESEEPPEIDTPTEAKPKRSLQALVLGILLLIAMSVAGVAGMLVWQNLQPAPSPDPQDSITTPDS